MAFEIEKRNVGDVNPFEFYPTDANLTAGTACVLTAGKLTLCGATVKPTHIAVGPKGADGKAAAMAVLPSTIYRVPCTANATAALVGSSVTLHTDAKQVTTTTASGVFKVLTAEGDSVTGIFA